MASIKNLYYKKIAQDILDDKNNDYKWLNIKLKKHFRIDTIDKLNNYFVKPNDCRWWFGNTKKIRYNNICKKMPRGNRKEMQMLLEHIVNLRISYSLFIPLHPISGYKFEKDITNPGSYQICYKGVVVNKIIKQNEEKKDDDDNKCPICYEYINFEKNYIATLCGHKFCSICIFKNINLGKEQCPLCRANITCDKNYNETDFDSRTLSPPPPRWFFPRTPPPIPQEQSVSLRTPRQSSIVTRESSVVRLHPIMNNRPIHQLFTHNDLTQIRNGYSEPILDVLEEIREFYSDTPENELFNTSEMTGLLSNINHSITDSPIRFYNDNNDVTNDIFSNELTTALNHFVDETTNTTIRRQISDSNLIRNDINTSSDEYYYFYHDDDPEPSIPPEPISPPTEPNFEIITDISLNDIDNSFNFYRLHDFI